jgi:DNA modification methylase
MMQAEPSFVEERQSIFKTQLKDFIPFPRKDFRDELQTQGYVKKGKYSYIGKDGAVYDIRNRLNNLSGRSWTFFLNSVEVTNYPTKGPESYGHKLRRANPSPKPPQLTKNLIEFFTKEGAWVLDPFMGVGGTLLGGSLSKRNVVGFDISRKFIDVYRQTTNLLGLKEQMMFEEDARNVARVMGSELEWFDFILTDPPYCNMQSKPKTGEKAKRAGRTFSTPFTNDSRDIGNIDYESYLEELKRIVANALPFLKGGKYLAVFTKDIQPTLERANILHADIIHTLSALEGIRFKGYKIWFDRTQTLYPFGYPFDYVSNQFHQFILIFKKIV